MWFINLKVNSESHMQILFKNITFFPPSPLCAECIFDYVLLCYFLVSYFTFLPFSQRAAILKSGHCSICPDSNM